MRKIIFIIPLFICSTSFAQTHVEYISEKTDSMALINKTDIDIINNVFNERNTLDSLNGLNIQIIKKLETENMLQDSIINKQIQTITNDKALIDKLETRNQQVIEVYSKDLKKEKNKKISFQATTGVGILVIILLILL